MKNTYQFPDAGFGEQGVMGIRPGGAPLGFYPQLELAGMLTGRGDSKAFANAADPTAAFGPLQGTFMADLAVMGGTMLNQYNVPLMLMNSYKQVELAAQVDGKSRSYMWEAQSLNMLKAPIAAGGGVLTGVGAASVAAGNPLGLLIVAAGMGITGLANSIQVNPTSGERMLKLTDQALFDTALTTLTAFVGGAGAKMASMGRLGQTVKEGTRVANIASGIVGAGTAIARTGATYSSSGAFSGGFNFSGNQGTSALLAGLGSAAGSYAGAQMELGGMQGALFGDAISTGIGVSTEYGKYKAWGADQSGFMGMFNVDSNRFGALGGMGVSVAMNNHVAQREKDRQDMLEQRAIDALKNGQKHEARDILAGMGYAINRREEILAGMDAQVAYEKRDLGVKDATREAFAKAQANGIIRSASKSGAEWTAMEKDLARIASENGGKLSSADLDRYLVARNGGNALTATPDQVADAYRAEMQRWAGVMENRARANQPSQLDQASMALFGAGYAQVAAAFEPGQMDRYVQAHRAVEGIRGGRNFNWAAARERVLSEYLSPDEIKQYYAVVRPTLSENNWDGTQTWIGAKNFLFDRQSEIHKSFGAVVATGKWAGERLALAGGAVGRLITGKQGPDLHGWRELYEAQTAYRNQQIVKHYEPLRDVYKTIAANPDAAMAAGMTIALQDDVERGRYAAAAGLFAAETVATGAIGRAVSSVRMAVQASRMSSRAWGAAMFDGMAGMTPAELMGPTLREAANSGFKVGGRYFAPQWTSGLNKELQLAIMETLPKGHTLMVRSRAYPFGDGRLGVLAKQEGEYTVESFAKGWRLVDGPNGLQMRKSDLDTFALVDHRGRLVGNEGTKLFQRRVQENYAKRLYGDEYDGSAIVDGGHGPQIFGDLAGIKAAKKVARAPDELVYAFDRNNFLGAEYGVVARSQLNVRLVDRLEGLTVRRDYELQRFGLAGGRPAGEDLSLLTPQREFHTLYGDTTGGGHTWSLRNLLNGKTKFPASWSDEKILNTVSEIATDPKLKPTWTFGPQGSLYTKRGEMSRYFVEDWREGVRVRVIYEPASGQIISGFPIR